MTILLGWPLRTKVECLYWIGKKVQSKLEDMEKMSMKPDHNLCPDHPEEDLRFYCLPCEIPICRDCKVVFHEGHKTDFVANVAKGMRETLIQLLENTESEISTLKEKAEDDGKKVEPKDEFNNNEDILNKIKSATNETKLELDKLVSHIKNEIKLHDTDPNTERIQDKISKLANLKENILEALDNNTAIVTSFKKLSEEGNKLSEDPTDEKPLTRAVVEENLLSELKPFLDKIVEDIQNFDVKQISSGQPYAKNNETGNWTLGITEKACSAANSLARMRQQSFRKFLAELSLPMILKAVFWVLQLCFCSLPIIQTVPVLMLLHNFYPVIHPLMCAITFGMLVLSGLLMTIGRSGLKPGALLFTVVMILLACFPGFDHRTPIGCALIWTRHAGCISLYCLFINQKSPSKVLGAVGGIVTAGCAVFSIPMLIENHQLLFLSGKAGLIIGSLNLVAVCLIMCLNRRKYLKSAVLVVGSCILCASMLVDMNNNLIDADILRTTFSRFEDRVYWTVVRLVVCNVNMVLGMLVLMERQITTVCQRLWNLMKNKDSAHVHKN